MSHGRQRFSIIPAAAVTDPALVGRDLQVIALFGRHTDNRGWCCRSQVKMAREIGCGRGTVQRSIARLVVAGYLEQRIITRDNGADTAHEYRVILDQPDKIEAVETTKNEGVKGGAHQWAGVPTNEHPCPPMSGQGVPTHEWAPMLTTPINDTERERAREDDFEKARRAWPSGFADSREEALAEWAALTPDDRAAAVAEIDRFVKTTRAIGRKHFCGFAAYLRERRWEALPPRPLASPASAERADTTAATKAALSRPTAFMLANPHLFPERFGSRKDGGDGAAS
ncbi:helix-turn-helix domain-containing protein [Mesorhizobium sp. WSM2239]|uniref:Helix-turn-helix domain-containing protein n=2 Tax=unclassified Mesorhizobium TaxID=325217 RepID=A0AAU8D0Y6_9HYPH